MSTPRRAAVHPLAAALPMPEAVVPPPPPAPSRREPIAIPAAILEKLRAGKEEQTCPQCGASSAASHRCFWCGRDMTFLDWYTGTAEEKAEQRAARIPKERPANPGPEFRDRAHWPSAWGPYPGFKGLCGGRPS